MSILSGKNVVITGAARGLGAAYARAAAKEGATLVINDIDEDPLKEVAEEIAQSGGRAIAHPGDVSKWTVAQSLIERCVADLGSIDGLVNNAGIFVMSLIEEQDEDSFRRQLEVNLLGQAFCGTHALKEMLAKGSGAIINTFSGSQSGMPFRAAYSAATGAIASLTYSWAGECKDRGVRVNAIAPIAATREFEESQPFIDRMHKEGRISGSFDKLRETMQGLTPEMNAPIVLYLLSDDSAHVNGQGIRFTGDKLMLLTHPGVLSPPLQRDKWTFDEIRDVFKTEWSDSQLPIGLAETELKIVNVLV